MTVAIKRWFYPYGYGVSPFENPREYYLEAGRLEIRGEVIDKKGITLPVDLQFYLADDIDYSIRRLNSLPDYVGHLHRRKGGFEALLNMPRRSAPMVITALSAGLYASVRLGLLKVGRLQYKINSYDFRDLDD